MSAVVADTHAVLWMLLDSPRLSIGARSALQDAVQSGSSIYMAAISLVESEKHGGLTEADNPAYAWVFCNRAKGSDIGSLL